MRRWLLHCWRDRRCAALDANWRRGPDDAGGRVSGRQRPVPAGAGACRTRTPAPQSDEKPDVAAKKAFKAAMKALDKAKESRPMPPPAPESRQESQGHGEDGR